ncbi:hypothetical protein D9757_004957 [Collybiopsis confluens]|uniref:Uncharacterized protein n=1 Tax=Collybiopsis confluens TaxID=2823264 RepID=A0A8H5HT70_9AGAR|nr:hypothetical protein D9757_004957 [Collybiopsis confluens]
MPLAQTSPWAYIVGKSPFDCPRFALLDPPGVFDRPVKLAPMPIFRSFVRFSLAPPSESGDGVYVLMSPSPSRNSFAYTQISEIFIVNFDTSNMSIIAPGIYKIKNKSTSNYIAAHSGDQPYSIIRTANPKEHGTFPVFTFKIEPYQIGGASIASTFTNLYVGIAQPADGTPLEWAPSHEPQPVGFVPVNDGSYLIRLPPAGNLPVERYAYEKENTREVAVIRNLDESGLHWILEKA